MRQSTKDVHAKPLVVWCLLDGKPGHENQSRGLIKALQKRIPLQSIEIKVPSAWQFLRQFAKAGSVDLPSVPKPDLLIGAGSKTQLALLLYKIRFHAKALVLMRPNFPYGWFDFCVVPEHDRPPRLPNLLMTKGVLNSIDSVGGEHRPDQGLILVGGESAHFHWSDEKVCAQVRQILAKDTTHWSLSSSRRTPPSFAGKARAMAEDRLRWVPVEETKPGWVNEQLQRCGKVWITQDSVSMLYEALTAGCEVGVIELERNGSSRVSRGIESLAQDRWVTLFSEGKSDGGLTTLPVNFNEAERCAQWLLGQGSFDF